MILGECTDGDKDEDRNEDRNEGEDVNRNENGDKDESFWQGLLQTGQKVIVFN